MARNTRIGALLASIALAIGSLMALAPSASASDNPSNCTNDTKSVLSHTWDRATGTVTITHKGEKPLCKMLYVAVASWTFDVPEQGQWPQTAAGDVRGSIQNPGDTLTLTAPAVCGQRDAYADYGKEPVIGDTLTAPGKPYEAKFVHSFSKGVNTYGHDAPASCVKAPPVIMPEATIGQICEIGMSSGVAQYDNGMTEAALTYDTVVSDGQSFTDELAPGEIKERMFQFTGTVTVTITARIGEQVYELLEQELSDEDCVVDSSTPTPTPTTETTTPAPKPTTSLAPPASTTYPPTLAETGASEDERPALIRNAIIGGVITLIGIIAMAWGYKKPKTAKH